MESHPQHKVCCTCGTTKSLAEFNKLKKSKDGRQYSCRACNSAYHYANWDRHMSQIRARKRLQRAKNRAFLVEYLRAHPCADCGEDDLLVLEFDHLRDKTANISQLMVNHSVRRLLEEIAKCEVVCANCHRRRTAKRQPGNYRIRALEDHPDDLWAASDSDRDQTI